MGRLEQRRDIDPGVRELVGEQTRHGGNLLDVGFEMEQETVRVFSVAERLVQRELGAGERCRTARQLEGVAVPVQGAKDARRAAEERIGGSLRGQGDVEPADLLLRSRRDARAEHVREQLRAEADTEDWRAGVERPLDEPLFVGEKPEAIRLVDPHWSAHDEQPCRILEIRWNRITQVGSREGHRDALFGKRPLDEARALGCDVLQDSDVGRRGRHLGQEDSIRPW